MAFALDPRLAGDTHAIDELPLSRLLLMDDARYPWLILVPRVSGARELIDLDPDDQQRLLAETTCVSRVLRDVFTPHKLNIAALGNVVAQLHVHVIARETTDPAWPGPVWGVGERRPYGQASAHARIEAVRAALAAAAR